MERGDPWIQKFIDHYVNNLPDISDRPEINPESIQWWMKPPEGADVAAWKRKRGKTRFPAPHSRLKGMRGKPTNTAIDKTIASGKWCVTFRDEDENTWINLVDDCIVQVWLLYIMKLVRLRLYSYVILSMCVRHTCTQRGRPMSHSNRCQVILKYMLLNKTVFCKAYHDRMYFFSSGSKFADIAGPIKNWMEQTLAGYEHFTEDPDPDVSVIVWCV